MKRFTLGLAAAALVAMPSVARAQTLFTGSGCSGNTFLFCAAWTGTYVSGTQFRLDISNTSQNAPSSNLFSAFTQIAVGNVTVANPASMAAVTGWAYDANINGFNGFGLLANDFGSKTTNGINNALTDGNSLSFLFTFGGSIGTFAQAQTAFSGAQIAIHDQGYSVANCSSKGVLVGSTVGGRTGTAIGCGEDPPGGGQETVVPEPATMTLLATGLAGMAAASRRRRKNA